MGGSGIARILEALVAALRDGDVKVIKDIAMISRSEWSELLLAK